MDTIIKSNGLTFEYKTFIDEENYLIKKAVDNINFTVKKGEFVAILGHNGSGKSTLAKHLNALLKPSKGTIWIKGMDTSDEKNIWDIRQTAGMVFQNPDNQIIGTIVEEDVAFGPENLGVESSDINNRINEVLDIVNMKCYKKHSPNKLSGGQKQRIAIAGVLAMKPECIVLDEPTAMLDPVGRREVINTILKLNIEEKITIIHITHYMEEVINADRIFVMNEGKIVMEGTPREIFEEVDMLKKLKLDVPQIVELAYELRKEGVNLPKGILTIEEMVDIICQLK